MGTQSCRVIQLWERRTVGLYKCENTEMWGLYYRWNIELLEYRAVGLYNRWRGGGDRDVGLLWEHTAIGLFNCGNIELWDYTAVTTQSHGIVQHCENIEPAPNCTTALVD